MIAINLPANAMFFQILLMSILNAEILSPDLTTEKIWDTNWDY